MSFTYDFPRAAHTVDIIVMNGYDVLLIQRKHEPGKDMWALPGGHIDPDEGQMEAAVRELAEETGLVGLSLNLFDARRSVDPNEGWRLKTIYFAEYPLGAVITPGDDAKAAKWQELHSCAYPQSKKFLFSDHQRILADFFMSKYLSKE